MRTVSLVATPDAIRKYFPDARDPRPLAKQGIMSADFPLNPSACRSKFGRWLAERVATTRFDDDLSVLSVHLPHTEEDIHVRNYAARLSVSAVRTEGDVKALHAQMLAWIEERRKVIAAYGDSCFRHRTVPFQWPVYGSAACREAETPEQYFDLCARMIRQMNPSLVRLFSSGETPPESFGVGPS